MKEDIKITNGEINYGKEIFMDEVSFYLGHSCDEWIIGGLKEAKQFAKDLLKTIKQVERLNNH